MKFIAPIALALIAASAVAQEVDGEIADTQLPECFEPAVNELFDNADFCPNAETRRGLKHMLCICNEHEAAVTTSFGSHCSDAPDRENSIAEWSAECTSLNEAVDAYGDDLDEDDEDYTSTLFENDEGDFSQEVESEFAFEDLDMEDSEESEDLVELNPEVMAVNVSSTATQTMSAAVLPTASTPTAAVTPTATIIKPAQNTTDAAEKLESGATQARVGAGILVASFAAMLVLF